MSSDGITIDGEAFAHDVGRMALLTGRSLGEELKLQAKGAMREMVKRTPPFNGAGNRSVAQAKRAGENAISRDLHRIFRPKQLVGALPEQHPNVAAIYASHKQLDKKARQARYLKPLYVDELKFRALQKQLEKRVGKLGGGFKTAAAGLGVPLPTWMRRHAGAAGNLIMQLEGDELYIVIVNDVAYASQVYDFARRVEWALQTQRGKMERQIPFLLKRHEHLVN